MNFTLKKSNLNFKVYTVPSKPTAPGAENDIAIISSVPMSNWLMSPKKPSGIPRNDGDVWIQYSTSGNTKNILKQNAMMIATIGAWQYVDGAWVDREAVSCQGGEWVDWITYLFKNGDEYAGLTGGWTTSGYSFGGTAFGGVINDGRELVISYVSGTTWGGVGTNNKVHLRTGTLFAAGVADAAIGEKYSSMRITTTKATTTENLIASVPLSPGPFAVSLLIEDEGDYYISFLGVTKVSEVRHG